MHEVVTRHAPGTFCWAELGTTDAEAARTFYAPLFGWNADEVAMGEEGTYTMLQIDGQEVAALYAVPTSRQHPPMRPHWLSFVTVDSADVAAARADALGGTVRIVPFDVYDVGRMTLVEDPTGAPFVLWEPRAHIGTRLVGRPGALCWHELATPDAQRARAFYTGLFGWTAQEQGGAIGTYTMFTQGGRSVGGMYQLDPARHARPAHWVVHFAVDDCDARAEQARRLGGTLMIDPTDIPNVGRFAYVQDPQGATFSILRMAEPA